MYNTLLKVIYLITLSIQRRFKVIKLVPSIAITLALVLIPK
jgi:hypothetical protein